MSVRNEMQGALRFLTKQIQGRQRLKGNKNSEHVNNSVQQQQEEDCSNKSIPRWDSNLYRIALGPAGTLSFISNKATTAAGESALMP
jgi:hypothetical protein